MTDEPSRQRYRSEPIIRALAQHAGLRRAQQGAFSSVNKLAGAYFRGPVSPVRSRWGSDLAESVSRATGMHETAQRVLRSHPWPAARALRVAQGQRQARWVSDAMLDRFRAEIPRISVLSPETQRALRRLRERLLPSNLASLRVEELRRVAEVSAADQVGLAWAPRAEIVQELLSAATTLDREQVLLDRAGDVLDDCAASLAQTDHPAVEELAGFGRKAVGAAGQGHWEAAQALATNVIETALEQKRPGQVERKALLRSLEWGVDDQLNLLELRRLLSGCGIPPSYKRYDYATRSPRFSRHGTVHCANGQLYQQLNALKAITLATSWLRLLSVEAAPGRSRQPPAD